MNKVAIALSILAAIKVAEGGPAGYAVCQAGCATAAGSGIPMCIACLGGACSVGCTAAYSACQSACAAAAFAPTP